MNSNSISSMSSSAAAMRDRFMCLLSQRAHSNVSPAGHGDGSFGRIVYVKDLTLV